ncbi:hypothetical protein FE275_19150 [Pseudomonas koreensis]|nr:hypothetical protein FE275_19150 [Pseudomonas koreensis]
MFDSLWQWFVEGTSVQADFLYLKCNSLWERACSRRRCVSQRKCRLTLRLREQARSHSFCSV